MAAHQIRRRVAREWLVALSAYALLVAPFGCQLQDGLLDLDDLLTSDLNTSSAGLFINSDTSSSLLAGGRNDAGDSFFVFGTRTSGGGIHSIDSVLVRTAAGEESFIVFEAGNPVFLQGPDGSALRIVYSETSTNRLAGTATVYDAGSGTTQSVDFEVDVTQIRADLLAAAEEGAATIQGLAGVNIEVPQLSGTATAKWQERSAGALLMALAVVPIVVMAQFTIAVMARVMAVVFAAVAVTLQAAVIVAFAPLLLLGGLLGDVMVRVESVPLLRVFVELPNPPHVDIRFE